jgi:hypothetical protein
MSFIHREDGAVSVDWVVLTAALVGLSLAAASQVASGVENVATDTRTQLERNHILDLFDQIRVQDDFENGRGDWTGGTLRDVPGFGNLLALDRNHRFASMPVEVDANHEFARVEFDMIVADSWDNERGEISIGGVTLVDVQHRWSDPNGPRVQTFEGADDTTVTLTRVSRDSGQWGNSNTRTTHDDYTYHVEILKRNDGSDLTLGASTNLSQNAGDEFFGIDNVRVTGTDIE